MEPTTSQIDGPKKRFRHKRPPGDSLTPLNFARSPRYGRILWHTYTHRYMSTASIAALLHMDELAGTLKAKASGTTEGPSLMLKQTQNAIRKLWQHGFLEKRVTYITTPSGLGGEPDVYILSDTGKAYVAEHLVGLFVDELNAPTMPRRDKPHKGKPEHDGMRLLHETMVTDTLVALQLAAAVSPDYRVVHFEHDRVIHYKYPYEHGHFYINPDGLVILEHLPSGQRVNLFLEIDRSTESSQRWKAKLPGYYQLPKRADKVYTYFYDYYAENRAFLLQEGQAPKKGWLNQFIVLTVTQSPQRRQRLLQITQAAMDGGKGSGQFWFAVADSLAYTEKLERQSETGTAYAQRALAPAKAEAMLQAPILRKALASAAGQSFSLADLF